MSEHDRPAERHRRLRGKLLAVAIFVAMREMGEHEQPRPGLGKPGVGLRNVPLQYRPAATGRQETACGRSSADRGGLACQVILTFR
jgi:hypothetical protein